MNDGWGSAPGTGGGQPQEGPAAGHPQGGAPWPGAQQGGPQASAPAGTTPQGLPQRAVGGQQGHPQQPGPQQPGSQQGSAFPAHATGQPGGYGYPQQGGYGHPGGQGAPQQGLPQSGPYTAPDPLPRNPSEPDWAALADRNDAAARRRRRLFLAGGGVLAAAAVAGIVAVALNVGGGKDVASGPSASPSPSVSSVRPSPTPPPPPVDPLEIIGDKNKDTAPLSPRTLFPDARVSVNGRTYDRDGRPHGTGECIKAGSSGLGEILVRNKCRAVYRATYITRDIAVTVGIVEFDTPEQAQAVAKKQTGNIYSLYRTIRPFCRDVKCVLTYGSAGRYAYLTTGGYRSGKPATQKDKAVGRASADIAQLARFTLLQRGRLTAAQRTVTVAPTG
ncbi:hypothetical protein [Streptomyces sp. NPDC001380]|uniref:hypothetical protein n=1 Tax=Streptomyces sp. NPDC001380 TaxID=3364566 RepID=UPI0036CE71DC